VEDVPSPGPVLAVVEDVPSPGPVLAVVEDVPSPEPVVSVVDDEDEDEDEDDDAEDDDDEDDDDEPPVAQAPALTVLESSVTAPPRASSRPSTVAKVLAVIEVKAMIVPAKVEPTPSVAELPTCQKTLQAWAPLTSRTVLLVAVVRVDPAWKMKTASRSCWASSVNVPVIANDSGVL
jgi:hypothetical protein